MTKTHPLNRLAKHDSNVHIHSRDELASLDILQLRNKITETEAKISELNQKGLSAAALEIEHCYLNRELETRP